MIPRSWSDLKASARPGLSLLTKDDMIGWFRAAPIGSRHERMLWAARKIARLTGATEGGAYQMLLGLLIEADETAAGLDLRD